MASNSQLPLLAAPTFVLVAVITCQRADSLDDLLRTLGELRIPEDLRVGFLVVDNDPSESAKPIFEAHQATLKELIYLVEPRRGIPVARNRALFEAEKRNADGLCFIDDDEYTDAYWLENLVSCWRRSGANLLGGPVRICPLIEDHGIWKHLINASLISRQMRKNRKTNLLASKGGKFTIVTNNWLCDLHWVRQNNLRFDETFLHSGGSDTAFYRSARAPGCRTCWCPDAIVYERISSGRLSLIYQFNRARCQSINHFGMKYKRITALLAFTTVLIALVRFVTGCFLILFPMLGLASLTVGVRSTGWALGRIQALFGKRSFLYG